MVKHVVLGNFIGSENITSYIKLVMAIFVFLFFWKQIPNGFRAVLVCKGVNQTCPRSVPCKQTIRKMDCVRVNRSFLVLSCLGPVAFRTGKVMVALPGHEQNS